MADTSVRADAGVASEVKPLPKLTAAEFKEYNRMAEHMDYFVGHLPLETGLPGNSVS